MCVQGEDEAGTPGLRKVQAVDSGKQRTEGRTDLGCANRGRSNDNCEGLPESSPMGHPANLVFPFIACLQLAVTLPLGAEFLLTTRWPLWSPPS